MAKRNADATTEAGADAESTAAATAGRAGEAPAMAAGADGSAPVHVVHYVCKYTPVELLEAMGAECRIVNSMLPGFDAAEEMAGANICGFGKTLIDLAVSGQIRELVLVDCCDVIRSVYDILDDWGGLDFLYLVDMLHCDGECAREMMARECMALVDAYSRYSGLEFDARRFASLFPSDSPNGRPARDGGAGGPFISILGARMGDELEELVEKAMPLPVRNDTCVNNRDLRATEIPAELAARIVGERSEEPKGSDGHEAAETGDGAKDGADTAGGSRHGDGTDTRDGLLVWYAGRLFEQIPCMRMADATGRRQLLEDPNLAGIVYHTVKFCDFYSFEYSDVSQRHDVPLLKIESDYTTQSVGQLSTRLEAFAESLTSHLGLDGAGREDGIDGTGGGAARMAGRPAHEGTASGNGDAAGCADDGSAAAATGGKQASGAAGDTPAPAHVYYAGVDSGSTSTDVVVMDSERNIVASAIIDTGGGASLSAEKALSMALEEAGIDSGDVRATVATGYGRSAIQVGDRSVTEISCHARGARFLDPTIRTVIDIGGQDSKVIVLDDDGNVANFAMNDKCAAGTGRFLEMMARTLDMSLDEMSQRGLSYKEDITISSTCSVFAESEVVSLVAQDKDVDSIVHGLCKAVAVRIHSLARRVDARPPFMMTGGVSLNASVVKAIEDKLGAELEVDEKAQLCGAIGAALYASDIR